MKVPLFGLLVCFLAIRAMAVTSLIPHVRESRAGCGVCKVDVPVSVSHDATLPAEGYTMEITSGDVRITAADDAGIFYARQTLGQLAVAADSATNYPCCTIRDWPAYRWRGVLIDDCRHFFGRETVKRVLDLMAMYKLNVLHWHLTDDQGWRMDIPGMPELAKCGSVRPSSPKRGAELEELGKFRYRSEQNGQQYGPFYYTEADLREVVAYAAERHITIIPEVDLPGHMRSAIAAYPHLTCFPTNITTRMAHNDWGVTTDVLCVGNDDVLPFLEKVLDFVCDVFPSKVIHIGGDECPRVNWEKCPKCRARMKSEGLKDAKDLQGWMTHKMAEYLAGKGRRIVGWDEILAGDVPQSAIGQSWRTQQGNGAGAELVSAAAGAMKGHDMIVSPHTECYYNYKTGLEDDPFQAAGYPITLAKAYAFDPMTGVPENCSGRILGSEACLWSEYIWNEYDLEWKMWPRALAMAEILWSNPHPRDFADFRKRVAIHRKRLIKMGVNCQPLE